MVPVRKAETLKLKADWELAATERAIASATSPEAKQQAEDAKAKVATRIGELEAQLVVGKAELQPKLAAMTAAREAATAAERTRVLAAKRHAPGACATSSRYPSLSAAKPSAFMSAKPYSPY